MTYPQPPHNGQPPYGPPQQVHTTTGTDKSKKFLNLSAGALISVITGVVLVCCVGPIAFCFLSPFFAAIGDAAKTEPTVAITACEPSGSSSLKMAKIRFTVKNNGETSESFLVKFEVRDASGNRVGDGSEYVSSVGAGQTASEETTIFLDSSGATTCAYVSAS